MTAKLYGIRLPGGPGRRDRLPRSVSETPRVSLGTPTHPPTHGEIRNPEDFQWIGPTGACVCLRVRKWGRRDPPGISGAPWRQASHLEGLRSCPWGSTRRRKGRKKKHDPVDPTWNFLNSRFLWLVLGVWLLDSPQENKKIKRRRGASGFDPGTHAGFLSALVPLARGALVRAEGIPGAAGLALPLPPTAKAKSPGLRGVRKGHRVWGRGRANPGEGKPPVDPSSLGSAMPTLAVGGFHSCLCLPPSLRTRPSQVYIYIFSSNRRSPSPQVRVFCMWAGWFTRC